MPKNISESAKIFKACKMSYIGLCGAFSLMPISIVITAIIYNTYNSIDFIKIVFLSIAPLPIIVFYLSRKRVIIDRYAITSKTVFGTKSINKSEIVRVNIGYEDYRSLRPVIYIYNKTNSKKPFIKIYIAFFSSEDVAEMKERFNIPISRRKTP